MPLKRPMFSHTLFWQFSCNLYSKDKVAECCLALQDQHDCNVNVFLLCCYLDHLKLDLSHSQLHRLISAIQDSEQEIKVHRNKRIAARKHPQHYEALKQQELSLEQAQQKILIETLNQFALGQQKTGPIQAFVAYYQLSSMVKERLIAPVLACNN